MAVVAWISPISRVVSPKTPSPDSRPGFTLCIIAGHWPAYRVALDAAGKEYAEYSCPDANHGFHSDTTLRYDNEAADLAWRRRIEFFRRNLV